MNFSIILVPVDRRILELPWGSRSSGLNAGVSSVQAFAVGMNTQLHGVSNVLAMFEVV